MMRLFLKFELEKVANYFKTKTSAKVITVLLFLLVFLFVASGIYHFFVSGFRFIAIEAVEDIRLALTLFLYEVFLVVLGSIIIFSALISGMFNLFRGNRNNWVISSPLYTLFPKVVFIRSLMTSSLPLFVMFVPAILAFNKVYSLGVLGICFIAVSVILFLVILNALTLLLLLALTYPYYEFSKATRNLVFNFRGLITSLVGIFVVATFLMWKRFSGLDLLHIFKSDIESETLNVDVISGYFDFLPTHPFAMEILHWQNGETVKALGNFLTLFIFALILTLLWWKASRIFYPMWQKFQEGTLVSSSRFGVLMKNRFSYTFSGGTTLALFKKEILISSRNFKGVMWFLFLVFIWLMQIGANVILGHNIARHQPDVNQKVAILQSLQFIIAIYFISSFSLRFVFPSFSVERKTSWVVASAPISFKKIFIGKYLFYTSFFVILGAIMNYINTLVLNVPFTNTLSSLILLISAIVFIVTLALVMGAVFPSTETDDPEAISTSMSGLFFTAFSLVYGALHAFVVYRSLTEGVSVLWITALITMSALLTIVLLIRTPAFIKLENF